METIKINRNTACLMMTKLDISGLTKEGDNIKITLKTPNKILGVGERVVFKRYYTKNGEKRVLTEDYGSVISVSGSVMEISGIKNKAYHLMGGKIDKICEVDSGLTGGVNKGYYMFSFTENPCVLQRDIEEFEKENDRELTETLKIYDNTDGSYIMGISDDSGVVSTLRDETEGDIGVISSDWDFSEGSVAVMLNEGEGENEIIKYYLDLDDDLTASFGFNNYFYENGDNKPRFWGHSESGAFDSDIVSVYHDTSYYNVNVGLSRDDDAKNMFQDYLLGERYVEKVKDSLVGEPIDMEKIKYIPSYKNESNIQTLTGLTFNFHFRERVYENGRKKQVIYKDGWYTDESLSGWNGGVFTTYSDIYNEDKADELNKSDLLCYLDFTDNDIEMQKKKVGQSFVRLTFYDSTDPIEQKLLYYSTIFMDTGELFGRYIRKKRNMPKTETWEKDEDPKHVIRKEANTEKDRISSQICIYDEYETTKSSEGFNVYLFAADANFDEEISGKTIYMKVEYNHAGYGRTIPFIVWPKGTGNSGTVVTTKEYITKHMYIPMTISYMDGKYVYFANNAVIDDKNNGIWIDEDNRTMIFNLFEPKLEVYDG